MIWLLLSQQDFRIYNYLGNYTISSHYHLYYLPLCLSDKVYFLMIWPAGLLVILEGLTFLKRKTSPPK